MDIWIKWIYTEFDSEKTCHYMFDDYMNVNCPITIIFGSLIAQSVGYSAVVSLCPPHLFNAAVLPWETVKAWKSGID